MAAKNKPSDETVEVALALLLEVPRKWAAVPELSHVQEQALGLLVAGGLVERMVTVHLCAVDDNRAVVTRFRFTGQAGLAQALEPALEKARTLWGKGREPGKVYCEFRDGQGDWRRTDQGRMASVNAARGDAVEEIRSLRRWLRTPGVPLAEMMPPPYRFVPGESRPIVNGEGHGEMMKVINIDSADKVVNVVDLADLKRAVQEGFQHLADKDKDAGTSGEKEEKPLAKPIEELLRIEESQTLERKSSTFYDYKEDRCNDALKHEVVRTVAGFMNKDGGTLLIGVHDNGTVLGLEKDYACLNSKKKDRDGYQQIINQLLLNKLGKPSSAHFEVTIKEHEGKDICMVAVYRANTGVWIEQGLVLPVRTGNTTILLRGKEAKEYLDHRSHNG